MPDPIKDRLERLHSSIELSQYFLEELHFLYSEQPSTLERRELILIGVERLEAHAKELQVVIDEWRPLPVASSQAGTGTL